MIRHLIEALAKIQRELGRRDISFEYLLFLRSDIFDQLVAETSDRGKYNSIKIDWSDTVQLENLIKQRVVSNVEENEASQAWAAFNPIMKSGKAGVAEMIENSLMRPRFLIDLCENALSFAVNRGHSTVQKSDIEDALEKHSIYLVSYFGYEVRDVSGISEDIFYQFLGESDTLYRG
jgi:histone H3/H4